MNTTPNLELPYILAAQAQKHVTHNEAIRMLDAIVHLAVLDRTLTAPPVSPNDGDRYIVAATAIAEWSGHDGKIAAFQDGAWSFFQARTGWVAWVTIEQRLIVWEGTDWTILPGATGGGSGPLIHGVQSGRLTLVSGMPVPVGDILAASVLYWSPMKGNQIGLWTGSAWQIIASPEVSISLAGLAADTNFDVFGYHNSATLSLEVLAWSSPTARATQLATHDGVRIKSGDPSRRYLGSIRTTAVAGQCEDKAGGANTIGRRYVFNADNRLPRPMRATETAVSWSYTVATWRRMNNNPNIECRFIIGLDEEPVEFWGNMGMTSASTPAVGLAMDWAGGEPSTVGVWSFGAAGGAYGGATPSFIGSAGIGHRSVAAIERGNAGATFYGRIANAWNCGITGRVWG